MTHSPVYLICVTADNHNKYYSMVPNGDFFKVEYGRVNSTKTEMTYPISQWEKKYNEKIKKGYIDVSEQRKVLVEEISASNPTLTMKEIENESVRKIIEHLRSISRDMVKKNYTISAKSVTQEMVNEAQTILNDLSNCASSITLDGFNNSLIRLFTILPRRMGNVSEYLAHNVNEYNKIISYEQDLLDAMSAQIYVPNKSNNENNSVDTSKTILDEMGISMEECTDEDIKIIKKAMNESASKFSRAWKVTNFDTQKRFDKFVNDNKISNTKLLFHGSRSENWYSILKTGLKIRPSNAQITGKMFGFGCYFAPKCQKSIGYTSLGGSYWAGGSDNKAYMALFEVAYGKPYNVYSFDSKYYDLTYNKLQNYCNGANCLHAHADKGMLRNDEIVIYKEEQMTVKYLIEIKN